ncbi:MAG: carbon starvation protein A [Pirellulales bacterium]|nr:carbon starvation protein A [Pirellulales bacterium]
MTTLLIAVASFVGFIVAYHTYGKWLARKIFGLDPDAVVPSQQLQDNVDFIPTKKEVIFGHHFTSIAGTGPIVGPAIAVFWGWLPALLWVVFGSIFIGAVHDFGALVVSLRNRGQTVGEVAGRIISPRAKVLFLVVLAMALTVVLAIFGLVIAIIFALYPESVLSVWIEIPLAIAIGYWVYRRGGGLLVPSLLALATMYVAIYVGVYYLPINLGELLGVAPILAAEDAVNPFASGVVIWTCVLLVYCFIASVLPVWVLLQPRDYINSHQLVLALSLLVLGLFAAGLTGQAKINSAPAVAENIPADAPPIMPFLFITIACGAVSGFHCLVSSGTSSKQIATESDAQYVGYGAMLLEGALAVVVILACCAGVGMGAFAKDPNASGPRYVAVTAADGAPLAGRAAWETRYDAAAGWGAFNKLGPKVGAFIEGGANFLTALGIPLALGIGIIAVLVASFAATTLDTATRLQRYVLQELGSTLHIKPLTNKFVATAFAVLVAGAVALLAGSKPGAGGMMLWPLFGATNQLLAGLALMVTVFYLWRRNKPVWFALLPMLVMVVLPAWALSWQLFNQETGWWHTGNTLLICFGLGTLALQAWMVVEALLAWPKARGVLEESLPPLDQASMAGGRSC